MAFARAGRAAAVTAALAISFDGIDDDGIMLSLLWRLSLRVPIELAPAPMSTDY